MDTNDIWARGDCDEGPPPGYAERNPSEPPRYPTERPKEER